MLLLVVATYTYITLLLPNNKPTFADVRVLVNGRSNIITGLNAFQNMQGYTNAKTGNEVRKEQKNHSEFFLMSALNTMIPGLGSYPHSNNSNSSSDSISLRRVIRIALIEPTFTAAAYNNSFYLFYQKYGDTPSNENITEDLNLLSTRETRCKARCFNTHSKGTFRIRNAFHVKESQADNSSVKYHSIN